MRTGIVHGDPSLDNLHVDGGDIYFYDLELAAPGWQSADLTGGTSTDFAEVFLAGYTSVRPLAAVELRALPWLRIMMTLHHLYFRLVIKPALRGSSTLSDGWVDTNFADLERFARESGVVA